MKIGNTLMKAHLIDGFNVGFEYGDGWIQFNFGVFRITIWFRYYGNNELEV